MLERGSNKDGPRLDDELKSESEPLERSMKEAHVEEFMEKEAPPVGEADAELVEDRPAEEEPGSGHRIAGTGSSADAYSYTDHGETGGASHPKPKDPEERSERL